mgnify:CR=1 FL=1
MSTTTLSPPGDETRGLYIHNGIVAAGNEKGGPNIHNGTFANGNYCRWAMARGNSMSTMKSSPPGNGRRGLEGHAIGQWEGELTSTTELRRRAMGGDSRPQWKFSPSCDGKGAFNVKNKVISNNATPGQRTGHPHIIQKWTRATVRHPQRFCRSGDYNAHTGVNACVAKANDQEGLPNKRQRADRRQA